MRFGHLINIVNLRVQEVNQLGLKRITLQNSLLPIPKGIRNGIIGQIALQEPSGPMLLQQINISIGIGPQVIPSIGILFGLEISMCQFILLFLITDGISGTKRV